MKYIIRSTDHGERLSVDEIGEKAKAVKEKILEMGLSYLEYEGTLGTYNPMGERIEEQVMVIEDVGGDGYV